MDDKLLEIRKYTDPGYQPVVDFGQWRVAILNYLEEIHPARIDTMERHNETDEVFVLIKGQGILFLGEGNDGVEQVHSQVMEPEKIYNVKKGVWHTVVLSEDGSVLIVENRDTRRENSNYSPLNEGHRQQILSISRQAHQDLWR